MINQFYQIFNKGSIRALSFILALATTVLIFMNSKVFTLEYTSPIVTLLTFYAIAILWIHGMGLNLRKGLWKLIFNPFWGYLILIYSYVTVYL